MLKAAAQSLGQKVSENSQSRATYTSTICREVEAAFEHPDAHGGGTEIDIQKCLKQLLEDMNLSDEDTGTILIGMFHFLQADDLPVNSRSWRPLVFTALLAAVDIVLVGPGAERVQDRLKTAVVHWWPRHKADHAYYVFTSRERFRRAPRLTPSVLATWYFELRQKGLMMSHTQDSTTSAVASFDIGSQDRSRDTAQGQGSRRSAGRGGGLPIPAGSIPAGSGRPQGPMDFSSQDTSLVFSEDSMMRSEDRSEVSLPSVLSDGVPTIHL